MKRLTKVALIAAIAVAVWAAYWIHGFFEALGRMS